MIPLLSLFFSLYGDHRDLHVLTHSFPTRRSSDLSCRSIIYKGLFLAESPTQSASVERSSWTLADRSEEHTSELQSLMRISYAVFCLKKKNKKITKNTSYHHTVHNAISTITFMYEEHIHIQSHHIRNQHNES